MKAYVIAAKQSGTDSGYLYVEGSSYTSDLQEAELFDTEESVVDELIRQLPVAAHFLPILVEVTSEGVVKDD